MIAENQDNNKLNYKNDEKIEEFEEPLAQPGKIIFS